jgi:hypothetical protein
LNSFISPYGCDVITPEDVIWATTVPLYLKTRFEPDCSIVKFADEKTGVEPAEVAKVAVSAFPEMSISHVPIAVSPELSGTDKADLAPEAVEAPVPPFEIGVAAFRAEGFNPPDESKLLAKLAKLTACVILVPFQV